MRMVIYHYPDLFEEHPPPRINMWSASNTQRNSVEWKDTNESNNYKGHLSMN